MPPPAHVSRSLDTNGGDRDPRTGGAGRAGGAMPIRRRAWTAALQALREVEPRYRWRRVKSVMSATIALLLDLDWLPSLPWCWFDPGRERMAVS